MGRKISLFDELTTALNGSLIAIVEGTKTYKITFANLLKGVVKTADTGMISTTNVAKPTISLTTTFAKIPYGGIVSIDESNGHIAFADNRNSIGTNGVYALRTFASVGIPNNVDVEFSFF